MKPSRNLFLALAATLALFATSIASAGLGFQANFKTQQSGPDAKLGQVEVTAVKAGSPAERGGLKAGDEVVQINGAAVAGTSSKDVYKTLGSIKPGQSVEFVVLRAGKRLTLRLTAE